MNLTRHMDGQDHTFCRCIGKTIIDGHFNFSEDSKKVLGHNSKLSVQVQDVDKNIYS